MRQSISNRKHIRITISIHAPTWGATFRYRTLIVLTSFQSTHPRGVRLTSIEVKDVISHISIHAPTWGATCYICEPVAAKKISIHAPTWGATYISYPLANENNISIHAPTWGATCQTLTLFFVFGNFNPRTHVGCDFSFFHLIGCNIHFNPRTHVGCDILKNLIVLRYLISIHAPTWGATVPCRLLYGGWQFQSTHPRGVRRWCVSLRC